MKIDYGQIEKVKTPDDTTKELALVQARAYLASTDWYVLRFVETGKSVPKDVSDARESARAVIQE